MLLSDGPHPPFFASLSGLVVFVITVIGIPSIAFFWKRAIDRMEERQNEIDATIESVGRLTDKVDSISTSQTTHDTLLKSLGDNVLSMHTIITGHLEFARDRNDYIQNRLDKLSETHNGN